MSLTPELQRRQNNTEKVLALLRSKPREWINATAFMEIAGPMAWRTRISDARRILKAEGGTVENRVIYPHTIERDEAGEPVRLYLSGEPIISEYRYLPHVPLGPEASTDRPQLSLGGWR